MKTKDFTQRQNDEKNIEAIADNYKTQLNHPLWLADGLQKDVVQNSWDARINKKHSEDWECGFTLKEINNKKLLCITDLGTTGLVGTKFESDEELDQILFDNKPGEDLAYFLNSNFSAKSGEEGGSRGRGKTLFLKASKDKTIFFDSIRSSDNAYVFGKLYLDTKQVKFKLNYDDDGIEKFKEFANGKIPILKECGTRIFIVNPVSDIEKTILDGQLLSFISNSRWEIIKKYQSRIFIDDGREKKYATFPRWYEDKLSKELENIQTREIDLEIIKKRTPYRIKKLILRYAPNVDLPEAIKGIAIQRGGMTIMRILANDLVREEGMNDIYGWVEMENKPFEEDLKEHCESPEHSDFNWSTKPAKYLRDYIRSKIREFARELKIIETDQAKKNKIQKTAENEALKALTPFFKNLGLFGRNIGQRTREKSKRAENKALRLSIQDIKLPRDDKRINYGEKIIGTYVIPINDLKRSIMVRIRVFIVSDVGRTEIIEEKIINLSPGEGSRIGPESITISKKYPKGGYSFRAKMLSEEEVNEPYLDKDKIEKSDNLYEANKKFYIEMDPPESGPFDFRPEEKDDKTYLFKWEPKEDDEGYIIFYNASHPRIKIIIDDAEKLKNYLIEQGALIALQIKIEDLTTDSPEKDNKDLYQLIKSKNPIEVWPLFLKKYSEFLWDLRSTYGNQDNKEQ